MVLATQQKTHRKPVSHKRRSGHHHKKDEHYLKPYWPYIPLVLIVTVGLLFGNMWGLAQQHVLGYATEMSQSGLLSSTNTQRSANGLGNLALNAKLNQAAQAKANDMVARDYWSHNTPEGNPPWVFFQTAGYEYQTAGENLAYGFDNSDATVTAWMNSPPHKANVLGASYTEVGFGYANSANFQGNGEETVIVAMYASPAAAPTPAPAPVPAPAATEPSATTPAAAPSSEPTSSETEEKPDTTANAAKPESNATTNTTNTPPATTKPTATQNVTRLQLVAGNQTAWSMFVVSTLAAVCLVVFILRHGLFWHRMLVKSEKFVIHHKALDVVLVIVVVAGVVLTRSAGVIR
jgi:hypothetical protein